MSKEVCQSFFVTYHNLRCVIESEDILVSQKAIKERTNKKQRQRLVRARLV